jgi:sulfur carrier protein
MEVKLKLFATLRQGRFKEQMLNIKDNSRVIDIITQCNIPLEQIAICLVNGRDADKMQTLKNYDTVSLFPPIGGG